MKKAAGFTLLELLLVLVLVGVGTGLAIVSVDRLAERTQDKRWMDLTQQALQRLRNKAVLSGQPVRATVHFDAGTISSQDQPVLALPRGFRWEPAETSAPRSVDRTLGLLFLPDGTMQDARFVLVTPAGMRQSFRLERISGRIERAELAATP